MLQPAQQAWWGKALRLARDSLADQLSVKARG